MKDAGRWRPSASRVLMAFSGFAGLGYQIVWTQQSAVWLGHESAAVLAVVTAFFGGMAAGSLALGARIEKSARPERWYAGCECVIGLWSLALTVLLAPVGNQVLHFIGAEPSAVRQWTMAFGATFVLLLPATAAMGATLPAMERLTANVSDGGRAVAPLYASNTLGAMLGVLIIAFWLAPAYGLARTAGVCVAFNLLCAAVSLLVFRRDTQAATPSKEFSTVRPRSVLLILAITGFLGIGYEVLVVRVLSQVAEDTVYTFALLLAIYLMGTSIGAAAYRRTVSRHPQAERLGNQLLCALAAACLLGTASLWAAERVKAQTLHALGPSMGAALTAEGLLALIAFGLPTLVMGALFSHLSTEAIARGVSFGRALGVNTVGAALAPPAFGVLALPLLGAKLALVLIAIGYLLLTVRQGLRRSAWVLAPAAAALGMAALAPRLSFVDVPPGGRVISYAEGVLAAVSVVEDIDGVSRLRINNRQQEGSSATRRVDARQALLPILLHAEPRQALFLGLGTGVTASAAATVPRLSVDAAELLPEVIAASALFRSSSTDAPSPRLIAADARRYVRASARDYDVIVSDNFHPARSGSGALYTVEHFRAVRERLAQDGLFCQWLPLHQLDLETLRSIVQSFLVAFPQAWAMLASNSLETPVVGLVAQRNAGRFDSAALHARLSRSEMLPSLGGLGFEDEFAVLGSFIGGPAALRQFAGAAPANTDDRPVVAYRAPRITYAPESTPGERLIELLHALSLDPADLIAPAPDDELPARLAAYWRARNQFIEAGRNVRPSPDPREMLEQIRGPLLGVLSVSPDFRPAYDPLLSLATALARTDPAATRALLGELQRLQPERPEAVLVSQQIDTAGASPER